MIRKERGLTQQELADQLGVVRRAVSNWENGKRECGFKMLAKISLFFNVTAGQMLGIEEYY